MKEESRNQQRRAPNKVRLIGVSFSVMVGVASEINSQGRMMNGVIRGGGGGLVAAIIAVVESP